MDTAPGNAALTLDDLRDRRRALREEIAEVGHWRRLLRAKIDLTVSRGPGPRPLRAGDPILCTGLDVAGLVSLDLAAVCRVPAEEFSMGALPRLRSTDTRLARYEVALRGALMETTDEIVRELTATSTTPV